MKEINQVESKKISTQIIDLTKSLHDRLGAKLDRDGISEGIAMQMHLQVAVHFFSSAMSVFTMLEKDDPSSKVIVEEAITTLNKHLTLQNTNYIVVKSV